MSFSKCKTWIASVWFIGFGIILILFIVQAHVGQRYGENVSAAWGWFIAAFGPATVPTTAFLLGFLVPSRNDPDLRLPIVAGIVSIALTFFYVLTLLGLLLLEPLFNYGAPEDWLGRTSVLVLLVQTVFQAVVDLALAATIAKAK
jgi:hypothetical protein